MLNKEKYANELVESAVDCMPIAIHEETKKLCSCQDTLCANCYLSENNYPCNQGSCTKNLIHWANSEYVKPKEFTEQERAVIKALDKIEWVVKDCADRNWGFTTKPNKTMTSWRSHDGDFVNLSEISSCEFNSIKWEDTEPTSRAEILGGSEK